MKRVISMMLSFALLLSFSVTAASASSGETMMLNDSTAVGNLTNDPTAVGNLTNEVGVEQNIQLPILEDYVMPETVNLPVKQASTFSNGREETILFDAEPVYQELDFSNAIDITSEVFGDRAAVTAVAGDVATMDLPENQPPVADPAFFVLNPETMRDGNYTTETMFFIATRWNNTDLCYDPEGSPISIVYNSSFPAGYITFLEDTYGTYAGYAIHIFNVGTYPFVFAFTDMYGGMSEIFGINFDIISRGSFEIIEGSLSSVNDKKTYEITVDYSAAYQYDIGFIRTGTGGFTVEVYDSNGEKCGTGNCWGPGYPHQYIKTNISLTKPTGISGDYTYTVQVTTKESSYVEGDVSYRIAYGETSQKYYFFEDVSNCLDLPYYHTVRDFSQSEAEYVSNSPLSEYGDYYKFTATGTEAVTLTSTYGQYRYKILDSTTLETLYDGANLTTFKASEYSSYSIRVDINFVAGETYYVVVYDPNGTDYRGGYSIMVGDPKVYYGGDSATLGATNFVSGGTYIWTFTLNTPNGRPAYVDSVSYHGTSAGWPMEGGYFSVLTPGKSAWRTNSPQYYPTIDFKFDDIYTLRVTADGDWEFRIVAGKTGTYPGNTVSISYWFEL